MTTGKAILVGCGAAFLLMALLIVVVLGLLVHVSKEPEGMSVTIDAPLDVRLGEEFDLSVKITNERESEAIALSDIDIADEYLAGFTILSTEPAAKSSMHVPSDNTASYSFDVHIEAGESKTFAFKLRAEIAGLFRGEVDACEGLSFVSSLAQTVVKE